MRDTEKTKRRLRKGTLLRSLLVSLLGLSVLTVGIILLFFYFRTSTFLSAAEGKRLEKYLDAADTVFSDYIESYEAAAAELGESETIREILRDGWTSRTGDLYAAISAYKKGWDIEPVVHIVSPDRQRAVSSGFGTDKYRASRYASLSFIVENRGDIVFYPNSFTNAEGDAIVMTVARSIEHEGILLGYVFLDVKESEIEALFTDHPAVRVGGMPSAAEYLIFTKYNYLLYNETGLRDITYSDNGMLMKGYLTESFRTEETSYLMVPSGGTEYTLAGRTASSGRFRIVLAVPTAMLRQGNSAMIGMVALMGALLIVLCVFFAILINNSIIGPMQGIIDTMTRYGNGETDARCSVNAKNELVLVQTQLNEMIEETNAAIEKNKEMQEQLLLSQDNFLKAQIKPHFLNNVLESIRWMIEMGETEEATEALQTLGAMMSVRMNYYSSEKESLGQSLAFSEKYIEIQQLCYRDKIVVSRDIDEALLNTPVPTFLLQPLVENAIIHGIQPKPGKGLLRIVIRRAGPPCAEPETGERGGKAAGQQKMARQDAEKRKEEGRGVRKRSVGGIGTEKQSAGGMGTEKQSAGSMVAEEAKRGRPCVEVCVADDGVGIDAARLCVLLDPDATEHGIGLYNVHRRLQLSYGEEYGLTIRSVEGEGTVISALIPAEEK